MILHAVAKSNSEGRKRVGTVVWDSCFPTVFGVIAHQHFSRSNAAFFTNKFETRKNMKVINLFGGPCSGKSTIAAGLFSEMKSRHINIEYVTEVAKEMTWEDRQITLECQPYIFGKQLRNLWRLKNKVDYVITDSPLLLSAVYGSHEVWHESFFTFVVEEFKKFDNINFFLNRGIQPYMSTGRNENEKEAIEIDKIILNTLDTNEINYTTTKLNDQTIRSILDDIK